MNIEYYRKHFFSDRYDIMIEYCTDTLAETMN
jgi:hypothetical protein